MNVVLISTVAVTSADPGDRLALYGTLILLEVPLNVAAEPVKVTSVAIPLFEAAESSAFAVKDHDEITAAWATPGMAATANTAAAAPRTSFRIEPPCLVAFQQARFGLRSADRPAKHADEPPISRSI